MMMMLLNGIRSHMWFDTSSSKTETLDDVFSHKQTQFNVIDLWLRAELLGGERW